MHKVLTLLGVLMALATAACAAPVSVIDDRGRTITLVERPERIVAIGAFYVQTVLDLAALDRLVGVADSPDNPSSVDGIPSVGPVHSPSTERIVACNPDLVLGATDWNGDRSALEAVGVTVYTAPWFTGIDAVLQAVDDIGTLIGLPLEAHSLVERLARAILGVELRVLVETVSEPPRAAVVYAFGADSFYGMGTGTPEHELLLRARCVNALSGVSGFAQISIESLIAADPMFIITDPTQLSHFTDHPILRGLSAVRDGKLIGIPAHLFGSTQIAAAFARMVEALYDLPPGAK